MILAVCELLVILVLASIVVTQVVLPLWQGTRLLPFVRRSSGTPDHPDARASQSDLWIDKEGTVRTQKPEKRGHE